MRQKDFIEVEYMADCLNEIYTEAIENFGDENENAYDEQTNDDRRWLVDWLFEAFGTYGLRYNFQEKLNEELYEYEMNETA